MLHFFDVNGGSPDEPDALWTFSMIRSNYVNHGTFIAPGPIDVVWPNGGGKQLRLDVNFEDSSITDSVALNPRGFRLDSCYYFLQTNIVKW